MPVWLVCATCGRRFTGRGIYCRDHQPVKRPGYDTAERKRRKACVDAHRAVYGDWCPGWNREPHPAKDLTADHVIPVAAGGREDGPLRVLCRSCNSRKGSGQ